MSRSGIGGRLLAGLAIVLVPGSSATREICLEPTLGWGGFPCDIPVPVGSVGYSLSSPPCEIPPHDDSPAWGTPAILSLSSSDADPYQNQGPLPDDGMLHLWLAEAGCGYGFQSTDITVDGDFLIESYEAVAAGSQSWFPSADAHGGVLLLNLQQNCGYGGPPCPNEQYLGRFRVTLFRKESVPLESRGWGSIKADTRP